jgi:thioredoxin 1
MSMAVEATRETFPSLVGEGNVLVDFWGPRCQPCLALMPAVEALEESYGGRLKLVKVNAPENREVCRELKVFGLPTYVLYRDGAEVERLTGNPSKADIEAAVQSLVEGGE